MSKKSIGIFFILFILITLSVYASPRKDVAQRTTQSLESWQEDFDISDQKKGKYNILVTAADFGGNQQVSGPYNIWIDPDSDLPIIGITNPFANMRISGNMNIVGTCIDDDGVDRVELYFDGDETQAIKASGTDFWSYYFDSSNLAEGIHTVSAYGVDINGVKGKTQTIIWNLDRKQPISTVENHEMGALLSGKAQLNGTVTDGNGISSLSYSLDGGNTFVPLSLKKSKDGNASFSLTIDTTKQKDGAAICWLKARDKQGTIGYYTYLYFVDNTKPIIDIVYPLTGNTVNGIFHIAGSVHDTVGIKSFTWKMGKVSTEIPLSAGNPYWIQEIDSRTINASSLTIEFTAEDSVGNTTKLTRKILLNQKNDIPTLKLFSPSNGILSSAMIEIAGVIQDDDGASAVYYSIDKAASKAIETDSVFYERIPLESGKHSLEIWAEDIHGITSKPVSYSIEVPPEAPTVGIRSISSSVPKGKTEKHFYTAGMTFNSNHDVKIEAEITSKAPLKTVSYQIGEQNVQHIDYATSAKKMQTTFQFAIPKELTNCTFPVKISAEDINGAQTVKHFFFRQTDDTYNEFDITLEHYTQNDAKHIMLQSSTGFASGLRTNYTLSGTVGGTTLSSVSCEKPTENLVITIENNAFYLHAQESGVFDIGMLFATDTQGNTYSAGPFILHADIHAPILDITATTPDRWISSSLEIKGSASDFSGIDTLQYSIDKGNTWTIIAQHIPTTYNFAFSIPLASIEDGVIELIIKATDTTGMTSFAKKLFVKDTKPPEVTVLTPPAQAHTNGETTISFLVKDEWKNESVHYYPTQQTQNTLLAKKGIALQAGKAPFTTVGTQEKPLTESMSFTFSDTAGNITIVQNWDFIIDTASDNPIIEIHVPSENQIITTDFVISGIAFDDDGISKIWYKIDDNPFIEIPTTTNFTIEVALLSMTDNEHTITAFAEDIYGVRGESVTKHFRISQEEPKALVLSPAFEETKRGVIIIKGEATDKNGVSLVQVSLDNGNTYNDAVGTESWSYVFDSHIIQDGTHVLYVKVTDTYGIEGLYTSLMNIDNTAPDITLELPFDASKTSGKVFLSGYAMDNIFLDKFFVQIRSLDKSQSVVPPALAYFELPIESIIGSVLDLSILPNGLYNIEVTGIDRAQNMTMLSRNIYIDKTKESTKIDILYPLNGEHVNGLFTIYGKVTSETPIDNVVLFIDGKDVEASTTSQNGYFKFTVSPDKIPSGTHMLTARGISQNNSVISSTDTYVQYTANGPWITIDNFTMGDFAVERPWFEGTAGYALAEEEVLALTSKSTSKQERDAILAKAIQKIEISFDNGKTFQYVGDAKKWRYRLETQNMAEGYHFVIVRATMKNGEKTVSRSIIQIDKTKPNIKLISPNEGTYFNDTIQFAGLSSDDIKLETVEMRIRRGDKDSYGVPQFIQGLYLDFHFWGATLYDIGLGLTFFDDNVKLQLQFGQFLRENSLSINGYNTIRYGGNIWGAKLLANIFTFPFSYYFGPDWNWLSANMAIGANFSYFGDSQSDKGQILSAVIAQLEFPRITIPQINIFSTYSFYTEFQLWFIPTDIAASDIPSIVPKISGGIRINVFK